MRDWPASAGGSVGVLACEFGRRLAARCCWLFQNNAHRDGAGTRSRGRPRYMRTGPALLPASLYPPPDHPSPLCPSKVEMRRKGTPTKERGGFPKIPESMPLILVEQTCFAVPAHRSNSMIHHLTSCVSEGTSARP